MCGKNYPRNWKKVSRTIRRLAHGQCEWCHAPCSNLSVHHLGAPRPTGRGWKKGNPHEKHDVRRENLVALCWPCHSQVDEPERWYSQCRKVKRATKRTQHVALGIGTGLVVRAA